MRRTLISRTFPFCLNSVDKNIAENRASDSKSSNLLLQSGLALPCSSGVFHYSPPLLKSIKKLELLIDKHFAAVGGQKLAMSSLSPESLWKQTDRWQEFGSELVKTKIGDSSYCLCPTHEEAVCSIVNHYEKKLSHSHLPLLLYQTTTKFRGERTTHSGLLRCREFLMTDLYSFDANEQSARLSYDVMKGAYDSLFADIGVEVLKAEAATGVIGGSMSHEYHVKSDVGEDTVMICKDTGRVFNSDHVKDRESGRFEKVRGIEVGHLFLLGTTYSRRLGAVAVDVRGKLNPCEMGCFGLGVTRIIAACLEVLSSRDRLRWPVSLAPYKVCIIPPKTGSVEEKACEENLVYNLYDALQEIPHMKDDVIIDDRTHQTVGWRLKHADLIGYPLVIVVGKSIHSKTPTLELIAQDQTNAVSFIPIEKVASHVAEYFMNR